MHNLARSEAELGEVEQAKQHYQEVLNNCPPEDEQSKASTIHNLARIYAKQGNVTQAISLYQQSLDLYERIGYIQRKAASLAMLGQLLADERQDFSTALSYLEQSLEILQHLQSPDAQVVSEILARIQLLAKEEQTNS